MWAHQSHQSSANSIPTSVFVSARRRRGKSCFAPPIFDAAVDFQAMQMLHYWKYSWFMNAIVVICLQSGLSTCSGLRGAGISVIGTIFNDSTTPTITQNCSLLPLEPSQCTFSSSWKAFANNKDANRITHVYGRVLRSSIRIYLFAIKISTRISTTTHATRSDEMQQLPLNIILRQSKPIIGVLVVFLECLGIDSRWVLINWGT